jgi:hypothetical protein
MKVLLIVGALVAVPTAAATVYGLVRTSNVKDDPRHKVFLSGSVPEAPEGLYRGSIKGREVPWKGKKFKPTDQTGINLFQNKEGTLEDRYPFRTYVGKGVKDKKLEVFKIDYNIKGNPLWLRRILDEVVEVEPGKLLGKVHVRWIFGITFTAGFFELEKVEEKAEDKHEEKAEPEAKPAAPDAEKPAETPQEAPAVSS